MIERRERDTNSNPGSHTMNYTCHVTIDFFSTSPIALSTATNSIQFFSIQLLTIECAVGSESWSGKRGSGQDRTEFCHHTLWIRHIKRPELRRDSPCICALVYSLSEITLYTRRVLQWNSIKKEKRG